MSSPDPRAPRRRDSIARDATTPARTRPGEQAPTRRQVLFRGLGLALGSAGLTGLAPRLRAQGPAPAQRLPIHGARVRVLTGPAQTGPFDAPWTDLGIPVLCPDGSMLLVCGDTFSGGGVGGPNWRSPVGLRSSSSNLASLVIDGSVGGRNARSLVPVDHAGGNTAIPSDAFRIGDTIYMHLMHGVIYRTQRTELWKSSDDGETWQSVCQWNGSLLQGQFQQKTWAVAADGYAYVLSTVFNRSVVSGLLMHRVPHAQVGVPSAYQPWGWAANRWAWGNAPTTITTARRWGEICLRPVGDRFVFTWLNVGASVLGIRAQVLRSILSNYFTTPEQTIIVPCPPGAEGENRVASPYGGFIVPGSSLEQLHVMVSQWYDAQNYRVMQYRIDGLAT